MTPNEEIRRAQSKGNLVNSEPLSAHHANLCRSAQAVIEAARMPAGRFHTNECARVWVDTGYADESCVCGIKALREALAAHARNEQGTGEQP